MFKKIIDQLFGKAAELPDEPSALIRLAINDLEVIEKLPQYTIDMGYWHQAANGNQCAVCLAGAVMARTLKTPFREYNTPLDFKDLDVQNKLAALDHFRCGRLYEGFRIMGLHDPKITPMSQAYIPDYHHHPEGFKLGMRNMADSLEFGGW